MSDDPVSSNSIKYLDRETIGKISAGKVIPGLANVVKELIENSIDADATYIEIRFVDHGKELIEISDDGSGIKQIDFPNLALPHHTSKLKHYRDIGAIKSFGFRGEALASIAELSDLSIITRHSSEEIANELHFNNLGQLVSVKPTARPVGTTVRIKNLFYSYPVRRKEFESSYIKHFNNMMQFIYPYALGYTNLRLLVTNFINGRKNEVLNIEPKSIKDNIIQLLGCKQMKMIQPFVQHPIRDEVADEYKLESSYKDDETEIKINGYVSHGDKAPSKLKKVYFFLNQRPTNYTPLEKFILSVYKEINQTINPFVLLFVDLGKHEIDFSVHPDKRSFSLPQEKFLFAILKSSLLSMFETNIVTLDSVKPSLLPSSQKLDQNLSHKTNNKRTVDDVDDLPELDDDELSILNSYVHQTSLRCSSPADSYMQRSIPQPTQNPNDTSLNSHTRDLGNRPEEEMSTSDESEIQDFGVFNPGSRVARDSGELEKGDCQAVRQNNAESFSLFASNDPSSKYPSAIGNTPKGNKSINGSGLRSLSQFSFNKKRRKTQDATEQPSIRDIFSLLPKSLSPSETNSLRNEDVTLNTEESPEQRTNYGVSEILNEIPNPSDSSKSSSMCNSYKVPDITVNIPTNDTTDSSNDNQKRVPNKKKIVTDEPMVGMTRHRRQYDSALQRDKLSAHYEKLNGQPVTRNSKFFTKLAPSQSQAEDELKREMQKEAFTVMQIIGQFNKAFIIAKLDDDVFIIDQHASDERYNFEDLLENTNLEPQRLVNPIPLQLTCYQESLIESNINTFERLSFKIDFREENPPGSRVFLSSVPISQDVVFGKEEIEEILAQIEETGSGCDNYKPSKMVKMIASRACRKSIMINDSLDHKRMRNVLSNLVKLRNPWICAHGRPTVRFLFNVNEIKINQ